MDHNERPLHASDATTADAGAAGHPRSIGDYRLLKLLGSGGMGEVWLAEQTRPVHRQVAVKVIKPGMDSTHVIARFEAERQALALMSHPAIAAIFHSGTTTEGRPYFVMEYVPGESITAYCDRHRLSMHERVELFLDVCDGVHHAHQKGIIHRDLKPSNVLVTTSQGRPAPKIIDFGVAKAVSQPLTERTLFTEFGMLIGTPEYMSPEQAEMGALDIDIRTDVYALGVMLYELLTGALPFDHKVLREAGLEGIRRIIREKEPLRPSTRVTQLGPASGEAARNRHTDAGRLARLLRGDLDWIVMKTIEKDRTRRYGSASDLGSDLRRYLAYQPVLAGPPSAAYRVQKFARRHRAAVAIAATIVMLLAVGAVAMTLQARRIAAERNIAERERERAERVSAFLVNLFRASNPDAARGDNVTARELLERGRVRLATELNDQPLTRAALLHSIGRVYRFLGRSQDAESVLAEAAQAQRALTGRERADLASTINELGILRSDAGDLDGAEKLYREALQLRREALGDAHVDVANSYNNLAGLEYARGRHREAEQQFAAAVDIARRAGDPTAAAGIQVGYAAALSGQGRVDEAITQLEEATPILRANYGNEHSTTRRALNNLAFTLLRAGRAADAEPIQRELLAVTEKMVGRQHADWALAAYSLGNTLTELGRYDEAATVLQSSLDAYRAMFAGPHPQVAWAMTDLGSVEFERGNYAAAERLHREAGAIFQAAKGDPSSVAKTYYGLSEVYEATGRTGEAIRYMKLDLDVLREHKVTDAGILAYPELALGRLLTEVGRLDEAEPLIRDGLVHAQSSLPAGHWRLAEARAIQGAFLRRRRGASEAEPLLVQAVADLRRMRPGRRETRYAERELTALRR